MEDLRLRGILFRICAVALSGLVAGCSPGAGRGIIPASEPAALGAVKPTLTLKHLYVANANAQTVTVYDWTGKLVRTIRKGLMVPDALALDRLGNLAVANAGDGTVSIYKPGQSAPARRIPAQVCCGQINVAFDTGGSLYVSGGSSVYVYSPGHTKPARTLGGLSSGYAMAFDRSGNLYVADRAAEAVLKYAPMQTQPSESIVQGIGTPVSLACDKSGNLYVANLSLSDVTVYAPGKTSVLRTISQGSAVPTALTFDSSGVLYVADESAPSVNAYRPGSSEPSETFTQGLAQPDAVVASNGKLFVANVNAPTATGNVVGYSPPHTTQNVTIDQGISSPQALLAGP